MPADDRRRQGGGRQLHAEHPHPDGDGPVARDDHLADTFIQCGTGGSACTRTYDYGTSVTLSATPDTGYSFTAWSGACTGNGACPLTIDGDKAVGASFTLNTHTLTVTAPLHGTITSADTFITCGTGGSACTRTYDYGTSVTLSATPDTGYGFTAGPVPAPAPERAP